jgi:hypothetical protein
MVVFPTTDRREGRTSMAERPDEEEIDSEVLLAQGDELLRSSRRLIELLDGQIQGDELADDAEASPVKR